MSESGRFQFDELQTKCRVTLAIYDHFKQELDRGYERSCFAPQSKQDKLARFYNAHEKARKALYTWLEKYSPRDWSYGVPSWWSFRKLTYEDAITYGALDLTPEPAYGYTEADMQRFARALESRRVV